jgi:transposase
MDLSDFYKEYNERGEGRAAYDPKMMVALYLYAYCNKVRSSREIERLCTESVPFRVISGDQKPDHVTISRFRKDFEAQLASLMAQVVNFCYRSGLINLNGTSIDGTKIGSNASISKNRSESWIEEEIAKYLRQVEEADSKEDELYGLQGRKDKLLSHEERLRKLGEFKEILASEREKRIESHKEKLEERERYGFVKVQNKAHEAKAIFFETGQDRDIEAIAL